MRFFASPKTISMGLKKGQYGGEEYRENAYRSEVLDDVGIAVNPRAVHYSDRVETGVPLHLRMFQRERSTDFEEDFSCECTLGSKLSSIPSSPKKQRNDALGRRTNSP